jgi:hypothetical protein
MAGTIAERVRVAERRHLSRVGGLVPWAGFMVPLSLEPLPDNGSRGWIAELLVLIELSSVVRAGVAGTRVTRAGAP